MHRTTRTSESDDATSSRESASARPGRRRLAIAAVAATGLTFATLLWAQTSHDTGDRTPAAAKSSSAAAPSATAQTPDPLTSSATPDGGDAKVADNTGKSRDAAARTLSDWSDARRAEHDRHAEWWTDDCRRPSSRAVARAVEAAFAQLQQPAAPEPDERELALGDDGLVDLEQLTRDGVIELRTAALKDPALLRATVQACGGTYARRLFTSALVDQVQRLTRLGRTVVYGWRPA